MMREPSAADRHAAEQLLYREARLLDTSAFDEWLTLFAKDGIYWVPIDETKPVEENAAIIYDDGLRREERVFHLTHTSFPAQRPPSRTTHFITNVSVEACEAGLRVLSNQLIYELRTGDFRQVGVGDLRPLVASVEHLCRAESGGLKIVKKTVLLIDRDLPQRNLTFLI
jgi:3-phenylpropionate/cinnamic acid dioxygenase small subunit